MSCKRLVALGVAICWLLLATASDDLPIRRFLVLLAGTMVVSIYLAVRGPAWHEAFRLGRAVEQEKGRSRLTAGPPLPLDPQAQIRPNRAR